MIRRGLTRDVLRGVQAAFRLGHLPGHRDYTRFIILGRPRTGSNFLASALRSHGGIICFGELFNYLRPDTIIWDYPGFEVTPEMLALRERDPIEFIDSRVFARVPRHVKAVGFKLFYDQAQEERWRGVWDRLKAQTDCKVIHLRRRNIVRAHLSEKIAVKTERWSILRDDDAHRDVAVELTFSECLQTLEDEREDSERYQLFFADHGVLEVFYEDLVSNTDAETDRIQRFLGVPRRQLRAKTRKQARQPLTTMISNYDELKRLCEGTALAEFLDE
ncbi:MAG: sulfotransferase [Gemmatimonadota bacterium]|nr:sulfotransferase [Gemmatimonadota bacterium]